MREVKQIFIAFGIFSMSIFVVLLINSNINITGNVIVSDLNVNNCSISLIESLWDSIFDETSSGIIIETENDVSGYCNRYIAYKNDTSGQFWVIYGSIYNNSWGNYEYFGSKRLLNYDNILILYTNISDINNGFLSGFYTESDIVLKTSFLYSVIGNPNNYNNITNWSVQNNVEINNTFKNIYTDNLVDGVSWTNFGDYFSDNSTIDTNNYENQTFSYSIFKNESISMNIYHRRNYDNAFFIESLGSLPNYQLNKNSSWTVLFNLNEYFNVSSDVNIEFSSIGINNSNGEWIDYNINNGNVSFIPNENFTGVRTFELTAINPSETGLNISKEFNITIFKYNTLPNQTDDIEDIFLKGNESEEIDLDLYFEDNESDILTYYLESATETIDVEFTGNIMEISLKYNFSEYERFKIKVSDGFGNITTDYIHVWIDDGTITTPILTDEPINDTPEELSENTEDESPLEVLSSEEINSNENNINSNSGNDGVKINTNIIVVVIIMIFAIIAIIIIMVKIGNNSKNNKTKNIRPITNPTFITNYNKSNPPINKKINKIPLQQRMPNRRAVNPNLRNQNINPSYNRGPQNNSNQFKR